MLKDLKTKVYDIECDKIERPKYPDNVIEFFNKINAFDLQLEVYEVTTRDGYMLTLFRIGKDFTVVKDKPTVLLQRGIFYSADYWVNTFENDEEVAPFGIMLANYNYDVWLGNNRGNIYSLKHKDYDHETSKEYWSFSFP